MDHHTQNYLKVMRDLQEYFSKLDNQHPGPYPTFSNLIISYIFFFLKKLFLYMHRFKTFPNGFN